MSARAKRRNPFIIAATDSITGIYTRTPVTVAKAALELMPNGEMAAAVAGSASNAKPARLEPRKISDDRMISRPLTGLRGFDRCQSWAGWPVAVDGTFDHSAADA